MTNNIGLADERTLGAMLGEARASLGLTMRMAADGTKIPERYLALLEKGAYEDLPGEVYAKIYLKGYCAFLGIDSAPALARYAVEKKNADSTTNAPQQRRHPVTSIPSKDLVVAPRLFRIIALCASIAVAALYLLGQLETIVAPPQLTIHSPTDGIVTDARGINIEGVTEPEVLVRVNGKTVATDSEGKFKDRINLQEGMNTISVTAAKKYGKDNTVTRRVIVQPREQSNEPYWSPNGL
jgi:cytoskeletal protein RodZ